MLRCIFSSDLMKKNFLITAFFLAQFAPTLGKGLHRSPKNSWQWVIFLRYLLKFSQTNGALHQTSDQQELSRAVFIFFKSKRGKQLNISDLLQSSQQRVGTKTQ